MFSGLFPRIRSDSSLPCRRVVLSLLRTTAAIGIAAISSTTRAEINASGDIVPGDPALWTSSNDGTIGFTGPATLVVDGGSDILSRYGRIAERSGSVATVTIDGLGSTWTLNRDDRRHANPPGGRFKAGHAGQHPVADPPGAIGRHGVLRELDQLTFRHINPLRPVHRESFRHIKRQQPLVFTIAALQNHMFMVAAIRPIRSIMHLAGSLKLKSAMASPEEERQQTHRAMAERHRI